MQVLAPAHALTSTPAENAHDLLHLYREVRSWTRELCAPLEPEDYVAQSMPDASPTKWHIAHVSWFFETFLLKPHLERYAPLHPQYDFLFNSYYNYVGERHCRAKRGVVSRPTVAQAWEYREWVDEHMARLLCEAGPEQLQVLAPLIAIGLHHEQQHQELLLTDIKHLFSENPLLPAYSERSSVGQAQAQTPRWVEFEEGLYEIGHESSGSALQAFAFDNEGPRHRQFLQAFALCDRLVSNGEFLRFMREDGYSRPELWLSEGWATVQSENWRAPFYWEKRGEKWHSFTLAGLREVDEAEPTCHLSYFEADAFARWAGARLPSEAEWEVAALSLDASKMHSDGSFAEGRAFHPRAPQDHLAAPRLRQMCGEVWQWTRSQYSAYPGYAPVEGALGEYNGKFMCNQFVLRGASCATPRSHARATYRNFFPPSARWQFSGLRLARDLR